MQHVFCFLSQPKVDPRYRKALAYIIIALVAVLMSESERPVRRIGKKRSRWLLTNKRQKPEAPPESPTTAKALDFDDENAETTSSPLKSVPLTEKPKSGAEEDVPPSKPRRPLAPEQQAENTLKEAFPSIDAAVVKAVLRASGGRVEPAFNALLGIYCHRTSARFKDANNDQACRIQMLQSLLHRRNPRGHNGLPSVQHLQRKASLQQMSDTRGSLPSITTGLLVMVKSRDLDQATEGNSNVHPGDKQVDMIKMKDPVGLMVRLPTMEESK